MHIYDIHSIQTMKQVILMFCSPITVYVRPFIADIFAGFHKSKQSVQIVWNHLTIVFEFSFVPD